MKSNYKKLGRYIRQVDVRNTEGKEENLLGVSVQKMFIPSIANTVGTDFSKYKVVKKGQFTYIPDTSRRGDKIGIALLQDYEEGLVSNVYTVFEVIDEQEAHLHQQVVENMSSALALFASATKMVLSGSERTVKTKRTQFNPVIGEYVRMRSGGKCEFCGCKAPFEYKGKPYLELEHIVPFSEGGKDYVGENYC